MELLPVQKRGKNQNSFSPPCEDAEKLAVKKTLSTENIPCQHFNLGLLASRTVRKYCNPGLDCSQLLSLVSPRKRVREHSEIDVTRSVLSRIALCGHLLPR